MDVSHVLITIYGGLALFVNRNGVTVLAEDVYHAGLGANLLSVIGLLIIVIALLLRRTDRM